MKGTIILGTPDPDRIPYGWMLTHDSKANSMTRLMFAMTPHYSRKPRQLDGPPRGDARLARGGLAGLGARHPDPRSGRARCSSGAEVGPRLAVAPAVRPVLGRRADEGPALDGRRGHLRLGPIRPRGAPSRRPGHRRAKDDRAGLARLEAHGATSTAPCTPTQPLGGTGSAPCSGTGPRPWPKRSRSSSPGPTPSARSCSGRGYTDEASISGFLDRDVIRENAR